jgi:hypothetical protein
MIRCRVIWIMHKPVIITALVCLVLLAVSYIAGGMTGFEQGQISVASGEVTCVKSISEWICEENVK